MGRCIFCGSTVKTSGVGEHIIPESLGGALVIKDVCRDCNTHLNKEIDEPFKNQFLIQLARYSCGLTDKRGRSTKHPFGGCVSLDDGSEAWLDQQFQPIVKPRIVEDYVDDKYSLQLNLDLSQKAEMPNILAKKIGKELRRRNPDLSQDEIDKATSKAVADAMADYDKNGSISRKQTVFPFTKKMDLSVFERMYAKIAYEYTCLKRGESYLNGVRATGLRDYVYSGLKDERIQYVVFSDFLEGITFDHEKHYLVDFTCACYIRIFGFAALVVLDNDMTISSDSECELLELDPKNKTVKKIDYLYYAKEKDEK